MGRRHTEETRRKMSEAARGRKLSDEQRQKISDYHKGRPKSPEHRAKIGAAHKGRVFTEEHRRNISLGKTGKTHRGVPHTEETKRRISEAKKGSPGPTAEAKAKIIAKSKERTGALHPLWRGDDVSYGALHSWLIRQFGRPSICDTCGQTESRIEWANVSGDYRRERSDWIWLCVSCHRKRDSNLPLELRGMKARRFGK